MKNSERKSSIPRSRLHILAILLAVVGLSVSPFATAPVSATCSSSCVASMSASPGSGTYNPGNTVTVSIYVNSGGQTVNAVQSDFTYSTSQLQFQSIDATGTAFAIDASSTGGGGSVSIARGNISAVSGSSLLVAKVNFSVLSNTGTASITFTGGSTVASSTTNQDILGTKSGASYTVANPATPPPSTPPPASNPTPTTTTTTPKTTTTPTTTTPTPTTTTPTPTTEEATDTPLVTTGDSEDISASATEEEATTSGDNTRLIWTAGLIGLGILLAGAALVGSIWYTRHARSASSHFQPQTNPAAMTSRPTFTPHEPVAPAGGYDHSQLFPASNTAPTTPTAPQPTSPPQTEDAVKPFTNNRPSPPLAPPWPR